MYVIYYSPMGQKNQQYIQSMNMIQHSIYNNLQIIVIIMMNGPNTLNLHYHGNGTLHKHLLIMRVFEKIIYLQDLFHKFRSNWSESDNYIVTYNVK